MTTHREVSDGNRDESLVRVHLPIKPGNRYRVLTGD